MKLRLFLLLFSLIASPVLAHEVVGEPVQPATNKDGSFVTAVFRAAFNPRLGLEGVPIPNNLFFVLPEPTTDITLNIPTDGLSPTAAALVDQLNSNDGFSTIERWTTTFNLGDDDTATGFPGTPAAIDPTSVIPGQSVRVFQVTTSQFVAVTGVIRELTPGLDYIALAQGNVVAIVPLRPLPEYSSFMAVLTNDIRDMAGNNATPSTTYHLSKSDTPWVDENGNSTYALLPDATARDTEGLRQITATMEAAAESAGVNHDDIVLAWTVQTTSITPTLGLLRSVTAPAPVVMGPAIGTTADLGLGLPGIADMHIGIITLPYYSGIPSAENPIAPLNIFWQAEPGAYIPPFDQFGLDPTSTNVSIANPFPVPNGIQTVPVFMTVPNANSGMSKPVGGWPVIIYGHGLGSNRITAALVADTFAAAGFAVIAIDFPMHGIEPWNPLFAPFYVGNTPFAGIANERTFNVDYINNETSAPGPDGIVDPSGSHALNFQEFRVSRDNVRQGVADLFVLASSVGGIDIDGDQVPDFKGFDMGYTGISWGGINGTAFSAIEPLVTRSFLNVPVGGLVRAGEASLTFGPRIRAGLEQAGIFPGDPLFELYLTVGQSVADNADPINWISRVSLAKPVMLQEVIGDTVLPNAVPGAPLSGTEPMISIGGLVSYSTSQANPDGLRSAARFIPPASHGSLISPTTSPAATFEMQGQMVTFQGSGGTLISVGNPDTMVQVVQPGNLIIDSPREDMGGKKGKKRKRFLGPEPMDEMSWRKSSSGALNKGGGDNHD